MNVNHPLIFIGLSILCLVLFVLYRVKHSTPRSRVKRTTRDTRNGRHITRVLFDNGKVAIYLGSHSYKTLFSDLRPLRVFTPKEPVKSGHVPSE